MNEQFTLFDVDAPPPDACQYPEFSAGTAYRNGCRCTRCKAHHRLPAGMTCQAPDCTARRQPHRRYCAEHGTLPVPGRVAEHAVCAACSKPFTFYESMIRQGHRSEHGRAMRRLICGPCMAGHGDTIARHQLDVAWSVRLIHATECELCHNRFTLSKRGRPQSHVDHSHTCCSSVQGGTCGKCVRGIICPMCNMIVGAVETAERNIGLDKVRAYLDAYRFR